MMKSETIKKVARSAWMVGAAVASSTEITAESERFERWWAKFEPTVMALFEEQPEEVDPLDPPTLRRRGADAWRPEDPRDVVGDDGLGEP